ncbi:DUF427 domain-containing protein [Bauldia sp.]|uniref:DUF427 domain-containing protein n=1 Tax=Bauldia sp. TaxID=2575872 RepID=UPI003BAB71C8
MSVVLEKTQAQPAFPDAIHNPDNPRHFMLVKPVPRRVQVFRGDTLLADTIEAIRVLEVGKTLYDPVLYIPAADIREALTPVDKTTHCPLKGDASYHAHNGHEIAWSYEAPFAFSAVLTAHRAFWPDKVRIVEGD